MQKIALVVDDAEYIRYDIRELFEEQGYLVYEAKDGLEAFELYKKIKPLVVTMDINMPRLHGIDSAQLITEFDPNAKIMMCSTMITFPNYLKMAKAAGAKSFLSKPFTDEEFFDELSKLFN